MESKNENHLSGHRESTSAGDCVFKDSINPITIPLSMSPFGNVVESTQISLRKFGWETKSINIHKLLCDNFTLREKLKEVTNDRDRLLCEISNLRLALDLNELKHVSEEGFPPKPIERSGSAQCRVLSLPGSNVLGSSVPTEGGSYVYLQQHYVPSTILMNATEPVNYQMEPQSQLVYQYHQQRQYPSCHHHQLSLSHHTDGVHFPQQDNIQNRIHHSRGQHQHPLHCGEVLIVENGIRGMGTGGLASSASHQSLHKKNVIRNSGDILKRSRAQSAYELSQDLLEKQIELLERKYGGICARNAAITIQRAFRHYMMVKKFASITAMAKAEKRRNLTISIDESISNASMYGSASESNAHIIQDSQAQSQQQIAKVTIMPGPPSGMGSLPLSAGFRIAPTRSFSMREKRFADGNIILRNQSGAQSTTTINSSTSVLSGSTHPHVNLLHATEPHYYSTHNMSSNQIATHCDNFHVVQHDSSCVSSNNSFHLDSPLNTSWVNAIGSSPHTPYYSAAQIYMRPRGVSTSSERKKVPPEVPKRTSSIAAQQQALQLIAYQKHQQQILNIRQTPSPSLMQANGLCKTAENGSLTSVKSSGSDSSATSVDIVERNAISDIGSDRSNSPNTWKRRNKINNSQQFVSNIDSAFTVAENTSTVTSLVGDVAVSSEENTLLLHKNVAQYDQYEQQSCRHITEPQTQNCKVSETIRKRQYRVGLNLFNKKPEKGITYLIRRGFLENTPQGVARFLITRKGLSRQMIGEYLGNLQNQFNMAVLNCFAMELDLSGMQVDVALRKFQAYFRMPGEAQKIERLMEIFSHRYCNCNQDVVGRLRSPDTIFVLAFAIIMLNTDLHTPNLKPERRMRVDDFIRNLRGIDDCHDIDKDMLAGIYERVKANEFKPGSDHVSQVMKVQATIVGKKPNLALPHRRLVCYCRLYEVPDVNKKERPGVHQREVFLFNDLLVITKIFSKKKSSVTYTFRNSIPLCGMVVSLLDVSNYPFCIQLSQKVDGKSLVTFNARNEHDRCKFAEDLRESISEMDEMEALRIEAELERQKSARNRVTGNTDNRDSGVGDVEVCPFPFQKSHVIEPVLSASDSAQQLKRSALSNSLLDIHEQFGGEKSQRRGSVGSLDSGMSISFQSTTTSNASRDNAVASVSTTKLKFTPSKTVNAIYLTPDFQAFNQVSYLQQPQAIVKQQQTQLQDQNVGRNPTNDSKPSRIDEKDRSTEV